MNYRKKTEVLAKKMACTIEINETPYEVLIQAPKGFHFDELIHEMVNSAWDNETVTKVWHDAYIRLAASFLESCTKECGDCFELLD